MCIDGAHAVHVDSKGHSGLHLTMGKGGIINGSKKLGVSTISSTEIEVVSNGERFPKCAWFRYFRMAQGDVVEEDILMQDNKTCTLMHNNHPFSVGKGSKHINVRYFFVVDKIKNKEVRVICCPTEEMVADFSSKSLQGKLFVAHRNTMLEASTDEFDLYKQWYKEALERYQLWDDKEEDLQDL